MNVAPTDSWVLISGENGTGKELVARTIHQLSSRADQPMMDINCAAIPEEFMDTELFGQERIDGSDIEPKKIGKFEMANHGTLFFDEIGDMHPRTQAKILRVLQEKQFHRIGGTRNISVDLRIIASTNQNLESLIQKQAFREDLYYRLNVVPIRVPPLRNRIEDVPALAEWFLDEHAKHNRTKKKVLSQDAEKQLMKYHWPGNIRELKNLMERITIMTPKQLVEIDELPPPYRPEHMDHHNGVNSELFYTNDLTEAHKVFEIEFIKRKLLEFDYDIGKTAKILGVKKSYIRHLVN